MDGVSIPPGPLGFIEKRNVGLRHLGMDVLQSNIHGAHGNREVLEAGEQVEKMVGGQGELGRLQGLRRKLERTEGQRRCQGGRGERTRAGRGLGGGAIGLGGLASQLESIGECLLVGANEAGEILNGVSGC